MFRNKRIRKADIQIQNTKCKRIKIKGKNNIWRTRNQRSYLRESVSTSRGGNVIPSLESFVVATSPFSHHTRRTPPCHMSHEYTIGEYPRANARTIEQKSLIIEDLDLDHPVQDHRSPLDQTISKRNLLVHPQVCLAGFQLLVIPVISAAPHRHKWLLPCVRCCYAILRTRDHCDGFLCLSRIDRSFDHRSKGTTHRSNVENRTLLSRAIETIQIIPNGS